jgi:hypothetical protein
MGKFVAILFTSALIYLLFKNFVQKPNEELNRMDDTFKSQIGKEFVLNKDTLLIIDYSLWSETFTLSNGREVNSNLVINSKKK